jgi:LysM repeat protein
MARRSRPSPPPTDCPTPRSSFRARSSRSRAAPLGQRPPPATTSGSTYTVGAGDTLSGIAAATGSSVSAIAATNGITTDSFIHVGQSLTIPGAGTTPKRPASTTGSYTVQSGDTLSGIAASTGSTVAAIAKASGISPSSFLQIGQRLTIPTRTDRGDSGSTTSGTTTTTGAAPGSSEWADTMPSRSEIRDLISATASAYGVDPRLALAIGWQESGWQQGVTSSVGAVGAMQVMPQSGEWAGSLIGRTLNLRDAHDNVTAGVVIIRQLTALAVRTGTRSIAAYYQGLGSVQRARLYCRHPPVRRQCHLFHDAGSDPASGCPLHPTQPGPVNFAGDRRAHRSPDRHRPRRPLSRSRTRRPGRNGQRVSRSRHAARSRSGPQSHARAPRRRPGLRRAVPSRGAHVGTTLPGQYRRRLRPGRRPGSRLPGDGVCPRPDPAPGPRRQRFAHPARRARHHGAGARRARRRAHPPA